MATEIYQLIKNPRKNKKNRVIGVVLASHIAPQEENGNWKIGLGWSMLHKSDTFDKQAGIELARDRALKGSGKKIPVSLKKAINQMLGRAIRYFRVSADNIVIAGK